MPAFIHRWLFTWIAHCLALKITPDSDLIGGKSLIYEDTEAVAQMLRDSTSARILTFHRYLPETHAASLEAIRKVVCREIRVFPMFPQFNYATTGSIARFSSQHLSYPFVRKRR